MVCSSTILGLFAVYLVFPLIFRIRLKQKFLKFVPSKKYYFLHSLLWTITGEAYQQPQRLIGSSSRLHLLLCCPGRIWCLGGPSHFCAFLFAGPFRSRQLLHLTGRQTVGHRAKVARLPAVGLAWSAAYAALSVAQQVVYRDYWFKQGSFVGQLVCPTAFLHLHRQPSGCEIGCHSAGQDAGSIDCCQFLKGGLNHTKEANTFDILASPVQSPAATASASKAFVCPGKLSNELWF